MGQQASKYLNKCRVLFAKLCGKGWQLMNKLQITYPLSVVNLAYSFVMPAFLKCGLCDLVPFHPNRSPSSKSVARSFFYSREMNLH